MNGGDACIGPLDFFEIAVVFKRRGLIENFKRFRGATGGDQPNCNLGGESRVRRVASHVVTIDAFSRSSSGAPRGFVSRQCKPALRIVDNLLRTSKANLSTPLSASRASSKACFSWRLLAALATSSAARRLTPSLVSVASVILGRAFLQGLCSMGDGACAFFPSCGPWMAVQGGAKEERRSGTWPLPYHSS
jgi:hypothetical protein